MILTRLEDSPGFLPRWQETEVTAGPLREAGSLLGLYSWMLSSET